MKKVVQLRGVALVDTTEGFETSPRESDAPLIRALTQEIIQMPDREDMVAEVKARVEAGTYHPSAEEIADVMVRRAIADRIR